MSCCQECCDDCCQDCTDSCAESCNCENCCQDCIGDCTQSCCDSLCDCSNWSCCGNASGISFLKINTLTSFTVMVLSLISGIIGFFEQVPISITILSVGLILTAFSILGLMIYPRFSRNE